MPKRFFWMKLERDFFERLEIKLLRKFPGGDTLVVVMLKLFLLCLDTDGRLEYKGFANTLAEELAVTLNETTESVSEVLAYLLKHDLLHEYDAQCVQLLPVLERIGSEGDSAKRTRDWRSNKKLQLQASDFSEDTEKSSTVTPSHCDAQRKRKNKIDREDTEKIESERQNADIARIIEEWNLLGLNQIRKITKDSIRHELVSSLLSDYGLEDVLTAIRKIGNSKFLQGENEHGWRVSVDWFVKPNNFIKVLEGNFDDRKASTPGRRSAMDDLMEIHEMFAEAESND